MLGPLAKTAEETKEAKGEITKALPQDKLFSQGGTGLIGLLKGLIGPLRAS